MRLQMPLHRTFSAALPLCLVLVGLLNIAASPAHAETKQPNILWIIAEDMGVELGCYGEPLVHTPNIDGLAKDGIRYTNVFATAPVCSAARSALMTGMYQTTIGAHNHRSHRGDDYQTPEGVMLITEYFRKAGYTTANIKTIPGKVSGTGKTDWNFKPKVKPFDTNNWKDLKDSQPFFAQINFSETHRNFKQSKEHPVDPADVKLPSYYPDHPVARKDWAMYLETVNVLDTRVGAVLDQLQADGLADNTIIFFFADHGRAHVRGKQWLYEGGIHIPLIVKFPKSLAEQSGKSAGSVSDQMISHIDISATSMALAGIDRPEIMQAIPFLGADAKPREVCFSARDRCDETVDEIRSIRTPRYKLIVNYQPERPYTQRNNYKLRQYPVLRLMQELHKEGKLTAEQQLFMAKTRPAQELYDLEKDPDEVHNLADSAEHKELLTKLRKDLEAWRKETNDQGRMKEDPKELEVWQKTAERKGDGSK